MNKPHTCISLILILLPAAAFGHGFALPAVTTADNSLGDITATIYVNQPQAAVISAMVLNLGVDAPIEITDVVVDVPETIFSGRIASSVISTYANGGSISSQLASATVQTSEAASEAGVLAIVTVKIPGAALPGDYAITTAPAALGPSTFTPTAPHYQGNGVVRVIRTPQVAARHLFYNSSYYDGSKTGIDPVPLAGLNNDDADAIDPSKSPLTSGTATFANWTGCDKGITGLIYDVVNASRLPVAGDFAFEDIGKEGTSAPIARAPSGFLVITGGGAGGADRVIITFAHNSIRNTWLQVTIGTGFGLAAPDVHYWGNAVAEGGTYQTVNVLVDATDEIQARNNPRTPFDRAPIDWAWDYDKNSLCDATDQILARNNRTNPFNCVKTITR